MKKTHRKCDTCKNEYRVTREAQSYCSPRCRRAAAYGRERFQSQTKGPRKRLFRPRVEASDTSLLKASLSPEMPSGRVVAGSFRKQGFSSTKTIPCRGVVCGPKGEFQWCGLALHFERRRVLTLVADEKYPHLFRIRYPDGWTSTPANITRAKDAAYGHAARRFRSLPMGVSRRHRSKQARCTDRRLRADISSS